MKKDTLPQKLLALLVVALGSAICGLGIQLTVLANLGVDPVSLFNQGMSRTLGISLGSQLVLFNGVTLTAGFFLCRRMVNWGSLVATLAVGAAIDFWALLLPFSLTSLWGRLPLDLLGVLVIGTGVSIYMLPEYGAGGMEALMVWLVERLKTPLGPTRVVMDCTLGLVGVLLGGSLGLGTVIGGVGIGMAIQLVYPRLQRLAAAGKPTD